MVPERITAAYYGMSNVYILSGDSGADGRGWIFFDIEVGGGGGRPAKDGLDCYSQGIHNLANTPIEMVETTYPLRFTRYEFIPDSGGAGRSRGVDSAYAGTSSFWTNTARWDTQFDKFKVRSLRSVRRRRRERRVGLCSTPTAPTLANSPPRRSPWSFAAGTW